MVRASRELGSPPTHTHTHTSPLGTRPPPSAPVLPFPVPRLAPPDTGGVGPAAVRPRVEEGGQDLGVLKAGPKVNRASPYSSPGL